MLSRTHDIGAFACLLTAAVYYPPRHLSIATILGALIANIIGSLLPDIDQASNRLWDLLPAGNLFGKIFRNLFLAHRTLSHSLLGGYLIYQLNLWLVPQLLNPSFISPQIIIYSVMIGYLSHLLLDALTEEGIPLLFPLRWKFGFPPFPRVRIKTGHWFEKFIIFPGIIFYIIRLFYTHWPALFQMF